MKEYKYCVFERLPGSEVSLEELDTLTLAGWERCSAPEGDIGRDLHREPTLPYSLYYFRKEI